MGLSIGQTPSSLSALNTGRATSRAVFPPPPRAESSTETRPGRTEPTRVQAGFGDNTVSGIAAAFQTLDTNLERAREVVPNFEELNAEARATAAELRARLQEQFPTAPREAAAVEPAPAPEVSLGGASTEEGNALGVETQRLIPEASGQVRNFAETTASATPDTSSFTARQEDVPVGPVLPQQEPLDILV